MATPVSAGAIWLYTIRSSMNSQQFINTLLVTRKTPISEPDYLVTAAAFCTAQFGTSGQTLRSYQNVTSTDLAFNQLTMQPIYPNRYQQYTNFLASSFGAIASASLPMNTGCTITKKSVNATRWGIGSMHLVGQPAANQVQGVWTSSFLTQLNLMATCIAGDLTAGDANGPWKAILWNKTIPARVSQVISAIAQDTTRVERRRTVRVGI